MTDQDLLPYLIIDRKWKNGCLKHLALSIINDDDILKYTSFKDNKEFEKWKEDYLLGELSVKATRKLGWK